jgi:hypothetical protein
MHEFLRKYVFRLDNQNATLGSTSSIEAADDIDQGGIHAKTARERNIENGSVKQARQLADEYLKHLARQRLESDDSHKV